MRGAARAGEPIEKPWAALYRAREPERDHRRLHRYCIVVFFLLPSFFALFVLSISVSDSFLPNDVNPSRPRRLSNSRS